MFAIGDFINKMQDVIGGAGAAESDADAMLTEIGGPVSEVLSNAGIDQSMLESLSTDGLGQVLEELGIDPSALSEGQLAEVTQTVLDNGGVDGLDIGNLLDHIRT